MNKSVSTLLACACLISLFGERLTHADSENDPIVNVAPSGGTFFDRPLPGSVYFKRRICTRQCNPVDGRRPPVAAVGQ